MRINFYGCSFSDGGGMDRWNWFQAIKDEDWVSPLWRKRIMKQGPTEITFNDLLVKFKDTHKFSTLIGKKLKCEIGDYAYTANNNQNIRDEVWNNINDINIENMDANIHIVQWSIYERRKIWYEKTQKFYRLQSTPGSFGIFENNTEQSLESKILQEDQYNWLKYHYNVDYEVQKIKMYTEMLDSFARDKGHHIYFMFHDEPLPSVPPGWKPNVIKFDGISLGRWIYKNNLTIEAESKGMVENDRHYSREGNVTIVNKIIETLKHDKII